MRPCFAILSFRIGCLVPNLKSSELRFHRQINKGGMFVLQCLAVVEVNDW